MANEHESTIVVPQRVAATPRVTVDDLAEKSGDTVAHILKIEDGHVLPGPAFVQVCAKALGIEPTKMLSGPPAR
jgi:transcriptional regulator with XRE-family HTH domain